MKRFLFVLTAFVCLFATVANGQGFNRHAWHFKGVYTDIDTLVLKNVPSIVPTMEADYLISMPKEQNLIIAYNSDRTKAIVLKGGYMWGKRMEFNVKDDGIRLVLWFKDEHLYCGYIYDHRAKACQYFEAINENEKDKLVERFPFLRKMPTFPSNQ